MTFKALKKTIVSLGLAGAFLIGAGAASSSSAFAQDWRHNRNRWENRRDEWRERQRARERAEWERRQYQRRVYPYYGNRGYYGNGGYYGNYGYGGYGYNSADQQRGYRDGLDRGQEDARDRRAANPNNSEHYRKGNAAYRDGFRQGYVQGYRQYGGYRW